MVPPAYELVISELRERSEAAAVQVLSRNRGALTRLSAVDQEHAERLVRSVAARLLEEPAARLKQLPPEQIAGHLDALRELFGLDGEPFD